MHRDSAVNETLGIPSDFFICNTRIIMYLLLRGVGRNKWSDVCAVPDLTPHISATRLHRRGFGLGKRLPQCLSRESSPGSCFFFFFVLIVLGGHPPLQRSLALHLEEAKRSEVARVLHGGPSSPQNSFLAPPKEEDHVTASQRRRWPQKQVWQHSQDLFLIKIH